MEKTDLKEKLKEAQEAVKELDEPLKTIAFQKILDKLLSNQTEKKVKARSKKTKNQTTTNQSKKKEDEETKNMINLIDKTQYPEIKNLTTNLDMALYILKIMEEKGYAELNPSQIKDILTNAFRIKSTLPPISMALMKANESKYTNRNKIIYRGAISYKYKLMSKGEDYINNKLKELKKHSHQDDLTKG